MISQRSLRPSTLPCPGDVAFREAESIVAHVHVADADIFTEEDAEGEGCGAVVAVGQVLECGREERLSRRRHRLSGLAGQGFLVVRIVGEAHPHLESVALVCRGECVGRARLSRQCKDDARLAGKPLVSEDAFSSPSSSSMADVSAVSVCPTCGVP